MLVLALTGSVRAFGATYDKTTYLPDGKTPMVDLYQDHLDETLDPQLLIDQPVASYPDYQ